MRIDERMNDSESKLFDMGGLTLKAMSLATKAFMEHDRELALQVVDGDKLINYLEEIINDQAVEALTLMQPVAKDLRLLLGGIKIVNDLERIGDYAKNIGRFVINSNVVETKFHKEILKLTNIFLHNFDQVLTVLVSRSVEEAYRVAELDNNLDKEFNAFIALLAGNKFEETIIAVELTNIAHSIERAGDHAKNICEQIIYIEKGRYIDFG